MSNLAKNLIKLFVITLLLIFVVMPLVQRYMTRTVESATAPMRKTAATNMMRLTHQVTGAPAKPVKQMDNPKGCVIFKEQCKCFDKLNNELQTTDLECRQFIKTP